MIDVKNAKGKLTKKECNIIEGMEERGFSGKLVRKYTYITRFKLTKSEITFSEEAGYYRIVVRNTIAVSVLKKNQELKTEKANKKLHGWGLRSVTDLVSKRNGLIDFYEKEGMFYVDILLPIEENLHLGD